MTTPPEGRRRLAADVRIDLDLYEWLEDYRGRHSLSQAATIRQALRLLARVDEARRAGYLYEPAPAGSRQTGERPEVIA